MNLVDIILSEMSQVEKVPLGVTDVWNLKIEIKS